jgi:ATP-dependent Clp protease ATP-binding subunit ClpX
MQGHDVEFTTDGLIEIARQAIRRKSGARGLRSIVEKIMLDTQFEMPGVKEPRRYLVDAAVASGTRRLNDNWRPLGAQSTEGSAAA